MGGGNWNDKCGTRKKSGYMKIRYTAKSIKYIHAVDVILEAGASGASAFPRWNVGTR